jgi:predicted Zn-dependent protease
MTMDPRKRYRWLATLAAILLLTGCATNPVTGERDFVLMSEQQELALGTQYHQQLMAQQYDEYDDPELQEYVSRLGQQLARESHRPDIDYTFTLVDSPQVNAFALPGGYVYITRGIMAYFNSEAELAGVLGHELGHVTARHSVRQQSAATASSIIGNILLATTDAGPGAGDLFQTVQLAAIRGYGRDHELEADRLGAEYLARTGYDPEEMLGVVRILADQEDYERRQAKAEGREPNVYHGIFSTHPENDARLQEVIRAANKYARDDPRPAGREAYLKRIDGMTYGPGASQGAVVDGQFLHLELDAALTAPADWTIDNQPQRVLFRAPDDAAALQVTLGKPDTGTTPRRLLEERIGQAELERGRRFEANGLSGYTGVVRGRTQQGPRILRHAVLIKDGRPWYFVATSRDTAAFDRFDERFLDIAASLGGLTPEQERAAQPLRIKVVRADANTTYKSLARGVNGVEDTANRLRLLNGDWPDGEPEAGELVKTLTR